MVLFVALLVFWALGLVLVLAVCAAAAAGDRALAAERPAPSGRFVRSSVPPRVRA